MTMLGIMFWEKPMVLCPPPNSDSYSFLGWYTRDGAQVTSASTVRADQTLTARWD